MPLVKAVLAMLLPATISGRLYLIEQLKQHGVAESALPAACIADLVVEAIDSSRRIAHLRGRYWKADLPDNIEGLAVLISYLVNEQHGCNPGLDDLSLRALLIRHGVPVRSAPEG